MKNLPDRGRGTGNLPHRTLARRIRNESASDAYSLRDRPVGIGSVKSHMPPELTVAPFFTSAALVLVPALGRVVRRGGPIAGTAPLIVSRPVAGCRCLPLN